MPSHKKPKPYSTLFHAKNTAPVKFPRATSEIYKEQEEKSYDKSAFTHEPTWRIFRIMSEFVEGFQFLTKFQKEVTFLGSARLQPGTPYYEDAVKLARMLAQEGYTIITGGGPGIMEAANKGASEGGGNSVGINIQLPFEQRINKYVKQGIGFHYFFTRKVILSASAQTYIFFPGGFGTLDEFFEIVTLIQTKKMEKIPVVLIGKDYWAPLIEWIENILLAKFGTINKEDREVFKLVDTIDHAFHIVKQSKQRRMF